jgi:predicted CoA-binding protein
VEININKPESEPIIEGERMKKEIQEFIDSKRIAIMGASRTGKKFGNMIADELKPKGYEVFLVHPEAKEISGQVCYPNIAALKDKVDAVLICLPPAKAKQAVQEVADAGLKKVWLQQGSSSPEVLALAKQLDLSTVAGKCIMMYADTVKSLHGWHRTFAKIFGQY